MAWDVTVPDTCAESHIDQTAREASSAANKAAVNKIVKYDAESASRIFFPVAVETAGTWNQSSIERRRLRRRYFCGALRQLNGVVTELTVD